MSVMNWPGNADWMPVSVMAPLDGMWPVSWCGPGVARNDDLMHQPSLRIDLDKIEHNTRSIVALCREHGIEVAGVTKAVCGNPDAARAMLRGGVTTIADSRMENFQRLRSSQVDAPFLLLRVPPLSAVDEVVENVDVSLNSELTVLEALSAAARCTGRTHDVMLMVDLGDLREGIWPDDLIPLARQAARLPGIRITGLGTNLACFGGVMPSAANMNRLVELASGMERCCRLQLQWISGINSSGLDLIASDGMPGRVNHARIGEAILLGRETTHRKPWPGTYQDAFRLEAEVIELKRKPSLPIGSRCQDAFGKQPRFEDRGDRLRALLNIGREDIDIDGITPDDPNLSIIGASSGYLAVDVTDAAQTVQIGSILTFAVNYSALLAAMTSEYVKKRPFGKGC